MRIAIVGAGPAGLYLGYLLKRSRPDADVTIFEHNQAEATFGFGVVFSDRALEFLKEDDPETFGAITPHLETWQDIAIVHPDESIVIDGIGFAAIGRLRLLQILQERARSAGVELRYGHSVKTLDELGPADLIVGADGVNSIVRDRSRAAFGASVGLLSNRFAWFGTTKPFETLTQTFRQTPLGHFNAHHYRYAPDMSTFIVEVDEQTFLRAGFDRIGQDEARALCEGVFADALDGHPLLSNHSIWRQFPKVWNERWSAGNHVLIGDALRTAHFSIGSGTRLALEDAIALQKAIDGNPGNIPSALQSFEAARRPVVEKLVRAANDSAGWYERFAEHMQLAPIDFVMSYITRSGRIDAERLRRISPRFARRYERDRPSGGAT